MPAVFAGGQNHAGGFRADQLTLNFGGDDAAGALVQNVQFSYTQQIAMLYEIGSSNVYYVGGRAQGSATLSRVAGPAAFASDFIALYNDLCDPQDIAMDMSSGCDGTANSRDYRLEDAVLMAISVSITSQEVVVNDQMQFIFANMEY